MEENEKSKFDKQNLSKLWRIFQTLITPIEAHFFRLGVYFSSLTLLTLPFVAGKLIDTAQAKIGS